MSHALAQTEPANAGHTHVNCTRRPRMLGTPRSPVVQPSQPNAFRSSDLGRSTGRTPYRNAERTSSELRNLKNMAKVSLTRNHTSRGHKNNVWKARSIRGAQKCSECCNYNVGYGISSIYIYVCFYDIHKYRKYCCFCLDI